jgi:hypothetical protein
MTNPSAEHPHRPRQAWPVECELVVTPARAEHLYRVYLASFHHLRANAAARQILTAEEFFDEMVDPRIAKYTVWRDEADPVALATVTNELAAVAWISPDFYAAQHPEHAARNAIYYLGIALVVPGTGQHRLLERLVKELVRACVADRGVLAYDVCAHNNASVQFGRRAEAILHRVAPVEVSVADTQTYYQAVFG